MTTLPINLIQENKFNEFKELIDNDPSLVNTRDEKGLSLMMHSLYCRRNDFVDYLQSKHPELTIFEAAALGLLVDVKKLVAADPTLVNRFSCDGFTPLHLASFFARTSIVKYLLEKGAQTNTVSKNEMSVQPLHSAIAGGSKAIVQLLLSHKADPNGTQKGGYTPLHGAAAQGNRSICKLLLMHGARADKKDALGKTAIDLAQEKGFDSLALFLAKSTLNALNQGAS